MIPEGPEHDADPSGLRPGQRAVTTSGSRPSTTSSFWRLVAPATMRTSRRATSELVGEQADQRVVGSCRSTAGAPTRHAQDAVDDAVDAVGRRSRRETDGEADVGWSRRQKARHRKPSTIRTTNPDQSIMPLCGSIRRTGARIGSVAWNRKFEIRCGQPGRSTT